MTQHVVEQIFKLRDEVTAGLNKMAGAADKFNQSTRSAQKSVSSFPSFGNILQIGAIYGAVRGVNVYSDSIEKIRFLTNATTNEASTLALITQRMGLESADVTRVFAGLQTHYERLVISGSQNLALWHAFGIDLKRGPKQTLVDISKAIQSGKLSATQLSSVFGLSQEALARLYPLLGRGSEELKKQLKLAENSQAHISAFQRVQMMNMKLSFLGLKSRMVEVATIIEARLAPIFTRLFDSMTDTIDKWMPRLGHFFDYLHDRVAAIAAIMSAIFKVKVGTSVIKTVAPILGFDKSSVSGGMFSVMSKTISFIGQLAMSLEGLLVIAAGFIVFRDIYELFSNFQGVGTRVGGIIDRITVGFSLLKDALKPIFDILETGITRLNAVLPHFVEGFLGALSDAQEEVTAAARAYPYLKQQRESGRNINLIDAYNEQLEMIHAQISQGVWTQNMSKIWESIEGENLSAKEQTERDRAIRDRANFDFRNSRFDIRQQFAEGFDPDRIAVAFANDLAKVSEMTLQSNQIAGNVRI